MDTTEEIQTELQEEIDLCNKYFIEEDMHKESTEHERLALKIVTMCMQTLSALKDGELEELKFIRQWKSDIMDSFCRYDVSSFEELVTNTRNKAVDDFVKEICKMIVQSENNGNYRFYAVEIKQAIADLAEQLKAGVTNDWQRNTKTSQEKAIIHF